MEINSNFAMSATSFANVENKAVIPQAPHKASELISSEASMAARAYAMPQINFGMNYEKMVAWIRKARPKHVEIGRNDLIRILQTEGFKVESGKGNHITARKPGEPMFVSSPHVDKVDPQAISWLQKYFERNDNLLRAAA